MRTSIIVTLTALCLLLTTPSRGETCVCGGGTEPDESVVYTLERSQLDLSLLLPSSPIQTNLDRGYICHNASITLTSALLWMPGRALRSADPTLITLSSTCTRVEGIHFLQPGLWQLRVQSAEGEQGIFYFGVSL